MLWSCNVQMGQYDWLVNLHEALVWRIAAMLDSLQLSSQPGIVPPAPASPPRASYAAEALSDPLLHIE